MRMLSALVFEVVATFLFLVCILGVTQRGAPWRRATMRMAASEYPASPAWKKGASKVGTTAVLSLLAK